MGRERQVPAWPCGTVLTGAKQSSCSGGSVDPFCLSRPPTHSLEWPDHPEGAILVGAANYSTLAQGLAQGEGA